MGSTHLGPSSTLHPSEVLSPSSKESVLARLDTSLQPYAPTALRSQVDQLVSNFVQEASDWKTLAALTAGGLAYRLGRVGVISLGLGAYCHTPLRAVSVAFGLVTEVAAFEFSNRALIAVTGQAGLKPAPTDHLWLWNGPGGWKQALLTDTITFGLLKGAGHLGRESNLVFQHIFSSTVMVVGHQGAAFLKLIPRPEGSLAEQFLHAETTNLQMMGGMSLVHSVAPGVYAVERELDLVLQFGGVGAKHSALPTEGQNASPLRDRWNNLTLQTAIAGPISSAPRAWQASPLQNTKNPFRPFSLSESLRPGGLSESEAQILAARYRLIFPPKNTSPYSDSVIETALETPGEVPDFHERLLSAYSKMAPSYRGSREQLLLATVVQRLFQYDPLTTGTGSFENALLQRFILEAISDNYGVRRISALQKIFGAMEAGLTRNSLYRLFGQSQYGKELALQVLLPSPPGFASLHHIAVEWWLQDFSKEDQKLWMDYIFEVTGGDPKTASQCIRAVGKARREGRYDPQDIDTALRFAKSSPFGGLVLRRMLHIFLIEDVPAKLRELRPDMSGATESVVRKWQQLGVEGDEIAEALSGTRHTAYLENIHLARKVVSVYSELAPYLQDPSLRRKGQDRLETAVRTLLGSGQVLGPQQLVDLLQANISPEMETLRKEWDEGRFEIQMLPGEVFDQRVNEWIAAAQGQVKRSGEALHCSIAFSGRSSENSEKGVITLKAFPDFEGKTHEGFKKAFAEIVLHLRALVHEWEHTRHSQIFNLANPNREERLISEIMANLEDQRWMIRNLESPIYYEMARRFGENLPLFFRNWNEYANFGRVNRRLTQDVR